MNHIAIMILNATSNLKECICMDLIGFEVSFSTVLFIFLPFIIQDKKNEYYLGYNISEWILYKRKNNIFLSRIAKKISDIAFLFIFCIIIIFISILLHILKLHYYVLIIFIVFLIYLTHQICIYLKITSNDKYILDEIEQDFLENCKSKELKGKDINNIYNSRAIDFLLKNFNKNKNIEKQYYIFHNYFIKKDFKNAFFIYNSISKRMNEEKEPLKNYYIDSYELYTFLKNYFNDYNITELSNIIHSFIDYSIKETTDGKNYNNIMIAAYNGIRSNKTLSDTIKKDFLNLIFKKTQFKLSSNKEEETKKKRTRYIFDFYKFIIDKEDAYGIEMITNSLGENINNFENKMDASIYLLLLVYLYYLIKKEEKPYVTDEEKLFLKQFYQRLKDSIKAKKIQYYYANEIDTLINIMKELSFSLERFNIKPGELSSFKTVITSRVEQIAAQAFLIIFKGRTNTKITDVDISTFRYKLEGNNTIHDKEEIYDFAKFIGIPIDDTLEKRYMNKLIDYATIYYKEKLKENNLKTSLIAKVNQEEKNICNKIKTDKIFNSKSINNTNCKTHNICINIENNVDALNHWLKEDIVEKLNLKEKVNNEIINYISKQVNKKIKYSYETRDRIIKKLQEAENESYYIRDENEELWFTDAEKEKYNKEILRLNLINIDIYGRSVILKNFKCALKNIKIEIRDLSERELNEKIKDFKQDDKYFITQEEYKIELTKNEILDYVNKKYFICDLVLNVGIELNTKDSYELLYKSDKE